MGTSAGAAAVACQKVANHIEKGVIVTIFADNGFKYLADEFWEEAWGKF